jgi:Na+-transporting methylmalonyl-CoA/oxaloacetate decarboxylase beta subunit
MLKRIALSLNIIGIIVAIGPLLFFLIRVLFWGDDTGTIALIGGENGPTTIFITSKISKVGMALAVAASMVFSINIYALRKVSR